MKLKALLFLMILIIFNDAKAGWAEGTPVSIQKSDYNSLHLVFIKMKNPVSAGGQCDSQSGVVFEESHESFKEALTFSMAALASGKKFRCWVGHDRCSAITGSGTTYPVCSNYPALLN